MEYFIRCTKWVQKKHIDSLATYSLEDAKKEMFRLLDIMKDDGSLFYYAKVGGKKVKKAVSMSLVPKNLDNIHKGVVYEILPPEILRAGILSSPAYILEQADWNNENDLLSHEYRQCFSLDGKLLGSVCDVLDVKPEKVYKYYTSM